MKNSYRFFSWSPSLGTEILKRNSLLKKFFLSINFRMKTGVFQAFTIIWFISIFKDAWIEDWQRLSSELRLYWTDDSYMLRFYLLVSSISSVSHYWWSWSRCRLDWEWQSCDVSCQTSLVFSVHFRIEDHQECRSQHKIHITLSSFLYSSGRSRQLYKGKINLSPSHDKFSHSSPV